MVVRQVKPLREGTAQPPKGRMTGMALAAIILFVLVLAALVIRPILSRNDAAGPGEAPASTPAGAPAAPAAPS